MYLVAQLEHVIDASAAMHRVRVDRRGIHGFIALSEHVIIACTVLQGSIARCLVVCP